MLLFCNQNLNKYLPKYKWRYFNAGQFALIDLIFLWEGFLNTKHPDNTVSCLMHLNHLLHVKVAFFFDFWSKYRNMISQISIGSFEKCRVCIVMSYETLLHDYWVLNKFWFVQIGAKSFRKSYWNFHPGLIWRLVSTNFKKYLWNQSQMWL